MAAKNPDYSSGEHRMAGTMLLVDASGTPVLATGRNLAGAKTLDVSIVDGTGAQITSFGGGTQFADGTARGTATGTLAMGDDGVNIQSVKVDTNGVLAIQDNGGSITVDAVSLPLPTGAATLAAQTQPGVDIGDVTINNASGAGAVNVQDGGNSITVDGAVTVSGTVTTSPPSNASTNVAQLAGTATSVNSGVKDLGTLRVVLATDQPALTNKLLVTPDSVALPANQSTNVNQFGGSAVVTGVGASGAGIPRVTVSNDSSIKITDGTTVAAVIAATTALKTDVSSVAGGAAVASVTGVQDVMPRKRTGSTGLSPNYSASRITSNTTTTPTAATAYIQSIVISCSGAGTSWTIKVQNKEVTPKIIVPALTLTVPTTGPIAIQFTEPVLMTSGIDIVTAGTAAGTVDVFVTYWQ